MMKDKKEVIFDREYYEKIMREFGYDPLEFGKINFSLANLTENDLQRRWLCHHDAEIFARAYQRKENVIVSTGIGLSGVPHIGTLSQILRAITLQKSGIPVNMVLGDFDAYNGKSKPLTETLELAEQYRKFIVNLGFDLSGQSILRAQYNALDVLRTSYIIGHYMDDGMFREAEEDLHEFYFTRGKVDGGMSYRRKLSLNLMIADFVDLCIRYDFKYVLVMLGIDEHRYVQFGKETIRRIKQGSELKNVDMILSGLYSPMIKGFHNHPKMSKSFPESGILVDMSPDEIRRKIIVGEGEYDKPENNVVYQMMASASTFSTEKLKENYMACFERTHCWHKVKDEYTDILIDICSKWSK